MVGEVGKAGVLWDGVSGARGFLVAVIGARVRRRGELGWVFLGILTGMSALVVDGGSLRGLCCVVVGFSLAVVAAGWLRCRISWWKCVASFMLW